MKIYIKRMLGEDNQPLVKMPKIISKGDWIDLRAAKTVTFKAPQSGTLKTKTTNGVEEKYRNVSFDVQLIPLGIAMKLPEGFEAIVNPRSSLCKNSGLMLGNSQGVIDNTYCGNNDEWKFCGVALRDTTINQGERICQFKIQLSQKATIWQKIKWLFSSQIELVEVDCLEEHDRNGFGSTGVE